MKFNFDYYKNVLFIEPIFNIIITILISLSFIKYFLKFSNFKAIVLICIVIISSVIFLSLSGSRLRYGYIFFSKNENDVITDQGVIEKVELWDDFFSPKFVSEYNNNNKGVFIYVNKKRFLLMGTGDLQVGNMIELKYLTGSNIVLEIQKK